MGLIFAQDVLFEKSTIDEWKNVIQPRVQGTWNIHNALLANAAPVDFFIMLASASGILGNPGQSAYAASNSFLDAFARYRRDLGLPASSIDIGLLQDVGYVAKHVSNEAVLEALVHDRINEQELHALVKAACADKNPECDYVQTITGVRLIAGKPLPFWAQEARVSHILRGIATTKVSSDADTVSIRSTLKHCTSREKAIQILSDTLVRKLSAISLIPPEEFDLSKSMDAYGIDSLVAVEVRNWMANELGVNLSLLEFMKITNLLHLSQTIVEKTRLLEHLAGGEENHAVGGDRASTGDETEGLPE